MKKIISVLLVAAIVISFLPVIAFGKYVLAQQDFESFEIGATSGLAGRYVSVGGTAGVTASVVKGKNRASKVVKLESNGPLAGEGTAANINILAKAYKGKLTFSFRYMGESFSPSGSVKIYDEISRKSITILSMTDAVTPVAGAINNMVSAYAQPMDTYVWYKIKLVMDTEKMTYEFWFNDEIVAQDLVIPDGENFRIHGIDKVNIQRYGNKNESGISYFDDILLMAGEADSEIEKTKWNDDDLGIELRFAPRDKQVCSQNPPFFNWPGIAQAEGYRLQVSKNKDMSSPEYDIEGIKKNFYIFPHTLEAGNWYYRVKSKNMNGETEWSEIRRFRIRKDAVEIIVPEAEEIIENIPYDHPRLWVTKDTLAEFREIKNIDGAREFYEELKKDVDSKLSNPLPEDPDTFMVYNKNGTADEKNNQKTELRNYSDGKCDEMQDAAFMYLITGEEKYGKKAAAFAEKIASWDPKGITQYNIQDQVFEYIAYATTYTYDWVYDFISPAGKEKILEMLEYRISYMFKLFMENNPLWELPYDSHKSSQAQKRMVESMALLHDLPVAEHWFKELFPVCIAVLPPWGGEDGGYSGGTAYASYGQSGTLIKVLDAIQSATGVEVFNKGMERNRSKYFMYFSATGSPFGSFGDEVYNVSWVDSTVTNAQIAYAKIYNDPYAKWAAETRGIMPYVDDNVTYKYYNDIEAIPPFTEMNSYYDRDIGWVMFMSDLVDPLRVGINFKASNYGAYNHTHAEQNSFNIYAYGEPLAVDSGYYDYYNSDHHSYYTKTTVAHNAITVNGGKGQYFHRTDEVGNMNSKGKIKAYIPGDKFNITAGDAAMAYKEHFEKADRYLIYLKPDYLICVDDLKTLGGENKQIEFNLHTRTLSDVYVDDAEAITTVGRAKLVSTVRAPEIKNIAQIDRYIDADGNERRPQTRHTNKKNQFALRFETEEMNETVMVTTMDILKAEENKKDVQVENNGKVMKLTVEGREVYIRLDSESGEVSFGDVTFNGVAAVIDGEHYALVEGTLLKKGNKTLVESEIAGSCSYEGGEAHISSDDNKVKMYVPTLVERVADEYGVCYPKAGTEEGKSGAYQYIWSYADNLLDVSCDYGVNNLYFNGTPVTKYEGTTVRINGTPMDYKTPAYSVNGSMFVPLKETAEAYGATVTEENGVYTVKKKSSFFNGYTLLGEEYRTITLKAGTAKVTMDGKEAEMSHPAEMKNGVLYVPLRGYFELFTDRIGWNDYAKTAYVYSQPIYHDEYFCYIWPRMDILTEEEQIATDNKVMSVFKSGEGEISYEEVFAVGEEVTFKAEPADGWYILKVTFNGEELKIQNPASFEYTAKIPHNLSVFYVYFSKYESGKAVVSSYPEMAREGSDLYYFARVNNLKANAEEYGILISSANENPKPGEAGVEKAKSAYAPNSAGLMGFKILTSLLENG